MSARLLLVFPLEHLRWAGGPGKDAQAGAGTLPFAFGPLSCPCSLPRSPFYQHLP